MQTQTPTPPEHAPSIPGYAIQGSIGEGGMGRVYRAIQLSLGRTVAIKLLHPSLKGQAPLLAFDRESRLMAALSHPHVVAIHDCGQCEGQQYLVMEYVAGSSLREGMEPGKPWTVARAAPVLDAIARALSYIHEQAILHLDLKPENVLCGPRGTIKITDFGLAVPQVDARTLSERGLIQGTLDYCSPEQRHGLPLDQRSDVFSLATLAYELLTGRLPGRIYAPASERNPELPQAVDEVLLRGLARDPNDRYASVANFRQDLNRALHPSRLAYPLTLTVAVATATLLLAVYVLADRASWLMERFSVGPDNGQPAAAGPAVRSWLLLDRPEDKAAGPAKEDALFEKIPAVRLQRADPEETWLGSSFVPDIPSWPSPLPVLVLATPGKRGFYHPLARPERAPEVVLEWPELVKLPPRSALENLLLGGKFTTPAPGDPASPWQVPVSQSPGKKGCVPRIGTPSDRPQEPALCLVQADQDTGTDLVCYQRLSRVPERQGPLMVLRYRARAEEGEGCLAVGVSHSLEAAKAGIGQGAARLRPGRSALRARQSGSETDGLAYRLRDWVKPGGQWRAYYVLWHWPGSRDDAEAVVSIEWTGVGKVWLDQLELFAWERDPAP